MHLFRFKGSIDWIDQQALYQISDKFCLLNTLVFTSMVTSMDEENANKKYLKLIVYYREIYHDVRVAVFLYKGLWQALVV